MRRWRTEAQFNRLKMKAAAKRQWSPDIKISDDVLAQLCWSEWECRHKGIWAFYYKATLAAALVLTTPVLADRFLSQRTVVLGFGIEGSKAMLLFPALAILIALVAHVALEAEYARFTPVNDSWRVLISRGMQSQGLPDRNGYAFSWRQKRHIKFIMQASLMAALMLGAIEFAALWGSPAAAG